jgi:hypothetical protein
MHEGDRIVVQYLHIAGTIDLYCPENFGRITMWAVRSSKDQPIMAAWPVNKNQPVKSD